MAVSFDCFGTLVRVDRPAEPWTAVAEELATRGVSIPDDWEGVYRRSHRDYDNGGEAPLDEHVRLALKSRAIEVHPAVARAATRDAFDVPVAVREGAATAITAAAERGPVAVCSNCSVPGLVDRTLERAGLPTAAIDAVITSVDCGWRKPHPAIFEATADALAVALPSLCHVGDDARTDGGAGRAGATTVLLDDVSLTELPAFLDDGPDSLRGDDP